MTVPPEPIPPYCTCGGRNGWTNINHDGGEDWVCANCKRPSAAVLFKTGKPSTTNPATHNKENSTMAKTTTATAAIDMETFLTDLRDLCSKYLDGAAISTPAPAKAATKPSKTVEPDEDESETNDRQSELEGMTLAALKKLAIKMGFEKSDVDDAEKEDIIESILEDEAEAAEAEAEEDEDEDTEDEEAEEDGDYTAEDLEGLSLTALKKIARDEFEQTTATLKGLDKDAIIALILGEEDEDEEADEDDEDEDSEDVEDDEDDLTEEDLAAMSLAELKKTAKEWGITVKAGMKRDAIIAAFFE